jgi:hypothetical protein
LNFRVVVERRTVMHNRAHFRESVWLLLRSFASPFTSSCICLITLASFSFPRLNTCASLHRCETLLEGRGPWTPIPELPHATVYFQVCLTRGA